MEGNLLVRYPSCWVKSLGYVGFLPTQTPSVATLGANWEALGSPRNTPVPPLWHTLKRFIPGEALQWSDPGAFGPRAYFATVARPASLTLSSVQLDDEGTYRCRVDFKNSPTRNFQIRLIVIVLPVMNYGSETYQQLWPHKKAQSHSAGDGESYARSILFMNDISPNYVIKSEMWRSVEESELPT
ncbi:jg2371 [Pararge aegeria aegeria]|uniref:Jg2371 protein n=1 Tax=Pararge aegeria aegeria TaxID=348720 RepID=A0A8S4R611_9NEOP|nr:jg2371 [Pararge aegeria aegeria]